MKIDVMRIITTRRSRITIKSYTILTNMPFPALLVPLHPCRSTACVNEPVPRSRGTLKTLQSEGFSTRPFLSFLLFISSPLLLFLSFSPMALVFQCPGVLRPMRRLALSRLLMTRTRAQFPLLTQQPWIQPTTLSQPYTTQPSKKYAETPQKQPSRFQQTIQSLRKQPASHLTSFLVLHELTAILPLPVLFLALSSLPDLGLSSFFSDSGESAAKSIARMFGAEGLEVGGQVMVNLATSYALVKAALPLRLALSLYLTPWFARVCISPIGRMVRRIRKRPSSGNSSSSSSSSSSSK